MNGVHNENAVSIQAVTRGIKDTEISQSMNADGDTTSPQLDQKGASVLKLNPKLSLKSVVRLKGQARQMRKSTIQKSEKKWWYIIMPTKKKKVSWDLLMFALLVYSAFQVPFALSFQSISCNVSGIDVVNLAVDILFLIDCLLSCITAYFDPETGLLVTHPKLIIKNYFRTWLLADILSSFPLDRIMCIFGQSGSPYIRFAKLLRWLKAIRFLKMVQMLQKLQDEVGSFASNGTRLLKLIGFLFLCTHLCACAWYGLIATAGCRIDVGADPPLSSAACGCEGDDCRDWNWLVRYDSALYHSDDADPRSRYLLVGPEPLPHNSHT
jgi:hypothetical protein